MSALAVASMLAAATLPAPPYIPASHSVLQLSQARRAIGAAATVTGNVIFAGGCTKAQSYVCDQAEVSAVIDVIPAVGPAEPTPLKLSAARGWPTVCALGESVAVLGGGQGGPGPHSRALDIVDMISKTVTANPTAMDLGRWGAGCITAPDAVYFAGGKVISLAGQLAMTDEVLVLPGPTLTVDGLAPAPWKLGRARESVGAMPAFGGAGLVWAGGWDSLRGAGPVAMVDAFRLHAPPGTPERFQWNLAPPTKDSYWVGAAPWNESLAYLADATLLYTVTPAVFKGTAQPVRTPLPPAIAAAHGITVARMGGNGVRVAGVGVCFYSATPSVLACYSPMTAEWSINPCSAGHTAGAMVAANSTVYVGGGLDTPDAVTAAVDVFRF